MTNLLGGGALTVLAWLAAVGPSSASAEARVFSGEELVFRGIPEHRVELTEETEKRVSLSPEEAKAGEVVVVLTSEGCLWRSGAADWHLPVAGSLGGGHLILKPVGSSPLMAGSFLIIDESSYGEYEAPLEFGMQYMEVVLRGGGFNAVVYRGRKVELYNPERCVRE